MTQLDLLNKKILVIGSGPEQIELIKQAKSMGAYVISTDKKTIPNIKKIVDKFYKLSASNFKKILKICIKNKVDGVISVCSEKATKTVSKLASKIKKPAIPIKIMKLTTNKIKMKNFFISSNIKTPRFYKINNFKDLMNKKDSFNNTFIIKPDESFGQKGVFKISKNSNNAEIKKKFFECKKFSINKKSILIEEFIDGQEINVVALVSNFKVKFLSISDRLTYKKGQKGFGIAYKHSFPSKVSNKIQLKIKQKCKKLIKFLGIDSGVIYPQVIIKNKEIFFIEVASRVPGGKMRELSMIASGYDPLKFEIFRCLNYKKLFLKSKLKNFNTKKNIQIKFFTELDLKNKKIIKKNLKKISNTNYIYDFNFPINKKVPILKNSSSRFGYLIVVGKSFKDVEIRLKNSINKFIK